MSLTITKRAGATIAIVTLSCWLGLISGAFAAPPIRPRRSALAADDWSVKASPNLSVKPPSAKLVDGFLRAYVHSYSDLYSSAELCSFYFADLRHDGILSLVAGTGVTDRPSCRDVYIIDKTSSGFKIYMNSGAIGASSDVADSIEDLHRDGKLEFILYNSLGSLGNECIATWPVIYAWTGDNYANVSERFREFYRRRMDLLNKRIAAVHPVRVRGVSLYEPPEKGRLCRT